MTALAAQAAKKALEMAKVDPDDVDLVLLCTSTPEDLFGSAPQVLDLIFLCFQDGGLRKKVLYLVEANGLSFIPSIMTLSIKHSTAM